MKNSLKLAIITPQFYPINGGFSNAVTSFILEIAKSEDIKKIDIYTSTILGEEKEISNSKINVLRYRSLHRNRMIRYIYNHFINYIGILIKLKKNEYDFIYFETGVLSELMFFTTRFKSLSKKCIVRFHGATDVESPIIQPGYQHRKRKFFIGKSLEKIDNIFFTNTEHLRYIIKNYFNNNPYLYYGKFMYIFRNTIFEHNLGNCELPVNIDNDKIYFLTLGRLTRNTVSKNFINLFYSLALLKGKDYFNKTRLIFVGKGEQLSSIKKLIQNLELSNTVLFFESLKNEEVQTLQKKVDCVILVSNIEGNSMFAMEAIQNTKFLILSNVGGLKDIAKFRKNNVLLVEPYNIKDISNKIDIFIRKYLNSDIKSLNYINLDDDNLILEFLKVLRLLYKIRIK